MICTHLYVDLCRYQWYRDAIESGNRGTGYGHPTGKCIFYRIDASTLNSDSIKKKEIIPMWLIDGQQRVTTQTLLLC